MDRRSRALTVVSAAVFGPPVAGGIGWLWTTDWRWAVTGVVIGTLAAVVGAQHPAMNKVR